MKDKKVNVFIQNLSDTTTVLQQLRVCIEEIKKAIKIINDADLETFAEDVVAMNLRLDSISEDVDELKEELEQAVYITDYEGEDGIVIDKTNKKIKYITDYQGQDGIEIDTTNKIIKYTKELYEHRITIGDNNSKLYLTVYSDVSSYNSVYDLLHNKRYACSGCYTPGGDNLNVIAVDVDPEGDDIRMFIDNQNQYGLIAADDVVFNDLTTKIL